MKYYFCQYEVFGDCPTFDFIVKSEDYEKALRTCHGIIKENYPEQYLYKVDFSLMEVTAEKLLEILTINSTLDMVTNKLKYWDIKARPIDGILYMDFKNRITGETIQKQKPLNIIAIENIL